MSVGSIHPHHKHVHQQGKPVTFADPASGNNVAGPATSAKDKALAANIQAETPAPAPTPSPDSSIGRKVDKSA